MLLELGNERELPRDIEMCADFTEISLQCFRRRNSSTRKKADSSSAE